MVGFNQKEVPQVGWLWGYAVITSLLTILALYMGHALEEPANLDKVMFYVGFLVLLLVFTTFDKLIFGVFTAIHNPEKGFLNDIDVVRNPLKLGVLTFIVFLLIFIIALPLTQKTFVGFATYQISPLANTFIAIEPASLTETLILATIFGFGYFIASKLSGNRKNLPLFVLLLTLGAIATILFMYGIHTWRYGAFEYSLTSVLIFFTLSVFILMITGSIIPLVIIHALNNGIGQAIISLGFDVTMISLIVLFFASIGMAVWLYVRKRKGVRSYA